jgi:hypothetical protein
MKRKVQVLTALAAPLFAMASQAGVITSGPYNGTNVGSADTLITFTGSLSPCGPGSSTAAETCWANSILGAGSASYFDKADPVSYYATDVADTYAFSLIGDPGYFIIKNSTNWALFRNEDSTDWGVFSAASLPSGFNLGGDSWIISHVTSFNGTREVPEPASLMLVGAGLLGLTLARRRKQSA